MTDLIKDTAKRLSINETEVFRRSASRMGFTNAAEVADYRYIRWFKFGEVPLFVENFCLDQWRTDAPVSTLRPAEVGRRIAV